MSSVFTLEVDYDGIAYITLDDPTESLNKLKSEIVDELDHLVGKLSERHDIKAMILASKKDGCFIAGADLKEVSKTFADPELAEGMIQKGHKVLNAIAELPFPTIALISGVCFGGGMELALAFNYRLATDHPKTALALPEVTLGIMPGWGGTQRAPRLIGLQTALTMILTGKRFTPKEALKAHLVDGVVPWPFGREEAVAFAHHILTSKGRKEVLNRRKRPFLSTWLLEGNHLGRHLLFRQAEKQVFKKTKGFYTAPFAALKVLKETATMPLEKGLQREHEIFKESIPVAFAQAPNLVGLFFAQEAAKKDPGTTADVKAKAIASAGVIGAGTMGSGIIWLLSYNDIPVRFKEADVERIGKGYGAVHDTYDLYVRKLRKLKPDIANLKFHGVTGTTDFSGIKKADIVVEAALEDLEFKKGLLQELEGYVSDDAIIATNTSSLSVTELASSLKHPERFIGMHFFNPVSRMPLVEVVPGPNTSPQTVATVVALCKKMDKTPLVVKDVPGFLVNRIMMPGAGEALYLLQEGVSMERIERVMLAFGMPMGPFVLADEIGNDVTYKVSKSFQEAYGERMKISALAEAIYEAGLFGRKVGKGFYLYRGSKNSPNPVIKKLAKKHSTGSSDISDQVIVERIIYQMINEGARCLQEGVVSSPAYVDLAMVLGTGFPPFRGGILRYADSVGISAVVTQLQIFARSYGSRYAPCDRLLEMLRSGSSFYSSNMET